jgi:hypothetical protein
VVYEPRVEQGEGGAIERSKFEPQMLALWTKVTAHGEKYREPGAHICNSGHREISMTRTTHILEETSPEKYV